MFASIAQITPWQTFSKESLGNQWAVPLKEQVCCKNYGFNPDSLWGRFMTAWDRLHSLLHISIFLKKKAI